MAFLGCSRGLGRAVAEQMIAEGKVDKALLVARGEERLKSIVSNSGVANQILTLDFSKEESVDLLLEEIQQLKPSRVFYFAGGGPYGKFAQKNWKDHFWALQVSFITPARLLHALLVESDFEFVKQIVFVGSQIADSRPDPYASSYAAGKHGLRGLVESVQGEGVKQDIRLFRPGYMDTAMLPKNARPRVNGQSLLSPEKASQLFVDWVLDPLGESSKNV